MKKEKIYSVVFLRQKERIKYERCHHKYNKANIRINSYMHNNNQKNYVNLFLFAILIITSSSVLTAAVKPATSERLSLKQKIEVLQNHITVKSDIIDAYFSLFNVNAGSRSIPGASSKEYKIILVMKPEYVSAWEKESKTITSYPKSLQWIKTLKDVAKPSEYISGGYITYHDVKPGSSYTVWVNKKKGLVLIHYIEF
jgi:hypothetical protein